MERREKNQPDPDQKYLEQVRKMIEDLDYGQVTIIVQDGKVVQIEQNRKVRLR